MIAVEEIIDYCLDKNKSYVDYPFGVTPICIKLNKKIFAQIYPLSHDYKITLKCDPVTASFYRDQFPGIVVRGYHCPPVQQPFWNTVYIEQIPEESCHFLKFNDTILRTPT